MEILQSLKELEREVKELKMKEYQDSYYRKYQDIIK